MLIIDTPGLDDEGELGQLRVEKARRVLTQADIAVLVVDAARGLSPQDRALIAQFEERNLPYVVALNKADLISERPDVPHGLYVSAARGENIDALKNLLASLAKQGQEEKKIVSDLLSPEDTVVLVVPIDKAAPKGRLILPQQLTIRDLLDGGCTTVICRDSELPDPQPVPRAAQAGNHRLPGV